MRLNLGWDRDQDAWCRDAAGVPVAVAALSDGYRSVLGMTFELNRQRVATFGPDGVFDLDRPDVVRASGVVLIDEIDAHPPPTWQKRIGGWPCRHFPNLPFIVSTHGLLLCQAAEQGSIHPLPRAGRGSCIEPGSGRSM